MTYFVLFIFGLVIGSFLNVVIARFDDLSSAVTGRSKCPKCGHKLHAGDLIPLVSYLMLAGKCRYCKKPISYQYPVVELAMGILTASSWFLISSFGADLTTQIILTKILIVIFSLLVILIVQDLSEMLVSDTLSYLLIIFAAIFGFMYWGEVSVLAIGAITAVVPILVLVYPSGEKWMGKGDIKIALALGLLVAYPNVWVMLATAFIGGGLIGAILILTKKAKPTSAVPFVPFLVAGAIVALFWGEYLLRWYLGLSS
ncbi:prepilin peptidase [Candidatus Berkelbacteria bacterium]|nr:prepilin peptidase [Candidatus Berkelbacteria bacterium]